MSDDDPAAARLVAVASAEMAGAIREYLFPGPGRATLPPTGTGAGTGGGGTGAGAGAGTALFQTLHFFAWSQRSGFDSLHHFC